MKDRTPKVLCSRGVGHGCVLPMFLQAEPFVRRATFGAVLMDEQAAILLLGVGPRDAAVDVDL